MKDGNKEKLAKISDRVDNLIHAMQLPIPAQIHLEGLKEALPAIKAQIDAVLTDEGGEP